MKKFKIVDLSDSVNPKEMHGIEVFGYTGYGNEKRHTTISIDISDLTIEQINIIGSFLSATFDDENLSSITGAIIRRIKPDDLVTNETKMVETFGADTTNKFKYYLTRVLTNSDVADKFYKWLNTPYVKGE